VDELERRYRRLLVAYPAGYRTRRADEIVATLLDAAGPGRTRPSLGEAADLVAGGLRQRLGLATAADLAAGRALAGPVALALAAGLSGFLWLTVEPLPERARYLTLGPVAYAAWVLALAGWAVLPARYARWPIGVALTATALVVPVAVVVGADRPPLWVVLALLAFGALTVTAAPPDGATVRAAVVTGALVTAALAKALLAVQLPVAAWPTGYYQPAIALSGLVVAAAVAGLAGAALPAVLRRRPARPWLWAALLLALPGGWLGPRTAVAGLGTRPGFGRLAEVLLATCVVLAAMAALTGVRAEGRPGAGLSRAGGVALGCAAGLAGFLGLVGHGHPAYAGWPLVALAAPVLPAPARRIAVAAALALTVTAAPAVGAPWTVPVTLALLGVVALLGGPGRPGYPLVAAPATLAACAAVAWYDNGWRVTGWHDLPHTVGLVLTLAIVPFAAAAVIGVRALRAGVHRVAGLLALLTGTGWIGALTLPHLRAWGPILLLVPVAALGGAVLRTVRAGQARAAARRALARGQHARLLALARVLAPDEATAQRLALDALVAERLSGGPPPRVGLVRAALALPAPAGPPGDPLSAAVGALPAGQRVALALRYRAELAVPEIAALLGIPAPAVRDLIDVAPRRLRELIGWPDPLRRTAGRPPVLTPGAPPPRNPV